MSETSESVELWRSVCEQAATEQDHERLLELVERIIQLLDGKEERKQEINQRSA